MVHNDFRLKTISRAALYAYMRRKHAVKRRWLIAAESFSVAAVVILSVVLQTYLDIKPPTYKLDAATYSLIGESRDDTAQYLTENKEQQTFSFAVPKEETGEASAHTGRNADVYSATLPKNAADGVIFTDTASNIDMTLMPTFKTYEGKRVDGDHIVYLAGGGVKLIYTLKYNGLKEDIVVPNYTGNELKYSFELSLPSGVEARLDAHGNIGIYSSDPTLFGDISFGSDEDRAKVDKARENGDKNNLVATIPSPIIKDANGNEYNDRASFSLGEKARKQSTENSQQKDLPPDVQEQFKSKTTKNTYILTLTANSLRNMPYPISIDPTMQVTNSGDFNGINYDGGVEFDSGNSLIKRGSLTGGAVTWATATRTLSSARRNACLFMLNGYIYIVNGRTTTTALHSTEYAPIDNDGNITAAWSNTTTTTGGLTGSCSGSGASHNGYVYVINAAGSTYAKQKTDGSLTSWANTSGFSAVNNVNHSEEAFAYNGYMYVLGGVDSDASNATRANVSYAPINTDGSLGTFASTSSLANARHRGVVATYNGYMYYAGGFQNGSSATTSVQRTLINSNGTLGTWIEQTNVLTSLRYYHSGGGIHNGYLYVYGGQAPGSIPNNTTDYAPINADGTIGTSRTTANLPSNMFDGSGKGVFYNGKLYNAGGCSTGSGNCADANTHLNTIYYATIQTVGITGTATTEANTFTTARAAHGTIVANGYIYVIGGCTVEMGSCDANSETIATTYYAPLNSNGTVGSWTAGTSLPNARGALSATISGNYIYAIGGSGNCGFLGAFAITCTQVYYASVNSSTGALSSWSTSGNALPSARRRGAAASYNGFIYYLGGSSDTSELTNTVYYASAGAGANGAWQTTSTLGSTLTLSAATVHDGYLYVGGGFNGTTNPAAVQYAQINSNGTLGAFANTSSMSEIRDGAVLQAYNGNLYIAGGFSGSTHRTSIEYAPINSDGTLGSFVTSPNGLITAGRRYPGAGGIHNGILYIAGGSSTGGTLNSVESIPINNGGPGNTGTWTSDATNLPTARGHARHVALNGYMYILGGCTSGDQFTCTAVGTGQYAAINTDGSLGTWASMTATITARGNMGAIAYNGRVYVIGGCGGSPQTCDTPLNTIQYATPGSNGDITSWTTNATNLPEAWYKFGLAAYDGYLYRVGGTNATANSAYAAVDSSTGAVGSWTAATSLVENVSDGAAVASSGFIYAIGGDAGSGATASVQRAALNGDHSIGTWSVISKTLVATQSPGVAVYNGYMYRVAGFGDTTGVEFAAILSGGRLGQWQRSTFIATGKYLETAPVYSGRIYSLPNLSGSSLSSVQEYAALNSIPRIGSFSKLYDFSSGVKPTKLITRGSKRIGSVVKVDYQTVNNAATSFTNSQSITDTGFAGINNQSFNLGSGITLSRYLFLRYTIDESASAIFPDSGNETTITDFDVYFTANPGARLRGGRTFVNGADRGLGVAP